MKQLVSPLANLSSLPCAIDSLADLNNDLFKQKSKQSKMATISEALAIAVEHHQNGRLHTAEQIYQQILQIDPNQAVAYQLLGVIAHQDRRRGEAIACFRRAIEIAPDYAEAHGNLGATFTELGEFDEAVSSFRKAISINPSYHQAHNNLGLALKSQGRFDEAIDSCRKALDLKPDYPGAHNNLGNALKELGRTDEAIQHFQKALDLNPRFAEALNNLGNTYSDQGELDKAFDHYQRALTLKPEAGETHNNLGNIYKKKGDITQAISCYKRALELKPDYALAHNNLGVALNVEGLLPEAIRCLKRAIELVPDYAEAYGNLGQTVCEMGQIDEAISYYKREIELKPENPDPYVKIGNVHKDQGQLDQAIAFYRKALELKPDHPDALNNVGNVYKDQGKLDEALSSFRKALELTQNFYPIHSNIVYTQLFLGELDEQSIFEESLNWNRLHAEPLSSQIKPHQNDRSPERRLRIGYVSPDFRFHPVGRFIRPLLEAHNRDHVEVFCYSSVRKADPFTDRCRKNADVWRNTAALSDEKMADLIREDQIDILVDLTMHMANHRLLAFARKPAPVQVTYLAYCGTTGLSTIDYRLTDKYLDPSASLSPFYTEQSVQLPETYWCYEPPGVNPTSESAITTGPIVFGSLNNFCKVGPQVLATWADILKAVPESRLLLHTLNGSHREDVTARFVAHGLSEDRIEFVGYQPTDRYLQSYQDIDIALDPFPYGGGTTTCDALWMGTPVVTLAGSMAVGRGSFSILSNIGLPELVAHHPKEYVQIAIDLAQDRLRLKTLKSTLQDRMKASPLLNSRSFARNVESAYRQMWHQYCETQKQS